jgi:Na+/H+ antiporter NhaD/arsenite permease-like protein
MIIPFALLLLAIAVMPLVHKQWWERNYPLVAFGLSAITIAYYFLVLRNPDRIWSAGYEYVSLIVLIGSLFVVAGGLHIRLRGKSKPLSNVLFLAVGAVVSNVVGTTGASMIMIRPYIRMNRSRLRGYHVIFFIFLVSNIGGVLTPIGDPPPFLGYLKGVPFFWLLENVWQAWALAVGIILLVFFVIDYLSYQKPGELESQAAGEDLTNKFEIGGIHNMLFLLMILAAAFVEHPIFARESIMAAAAVGSYFTTKREIHEKNEFHFLPLKEVAILFFGIFATMAPALEWLEVNSAKIGIVSAGHFYWGTGILSSVLANAPTYLNSLSASIGLFVDRDIIQQVQHVISTNGIGLADVAGVHASEIRATVAVLMANHPGLVSAGNVPVDYIQTAYLIGNQSAYLKAISVAAVFFGAMTYIGNAPNFMVKSIADHAGAHSPSFGGYVLKYSLPILIPVFALVWWIFL